MAPSLLGKRGRLRFSLQRWVVLVGVATAEAFLLGLGGDFLQRVTGYVRDFVWSWKEGWRGVVFALVVYRTRGLRDARGGGFLLYGMLLCA